ncbi:hypothetical protein ACHAW6_014287 [Cyclotella cf. meneghiniana]
MTHSTAMPMTSNPIFITQTCSLPHLTATNALRPNRPFRLLNGLLHHESWLSHCLLQQKSSWHPENFRTAEKRDVVQCGYS